VSPTTRQKDGNASNGHAHASAERVEFADLWRPDESASLPRGPERVLVGRGGITPKHLDQAAGMQRDRPHLRTLDALVAVNAVDELLAIQTVAAYFKLPFMHVDVSEVDEKTFERLPIAYVKAKHVLAIRQEDDDTLVGISDPADIFLIDDVKRRIGGRMRLVVVPASDILHVVEELSAGPAQQVDEIIKDITEDAVEVVHKEDEEVADLERSAGESPVIRYVNYLIYSAVREDASDIHIEPSESKLRIRLRIDGILFEQQAPPLSMHSAIISRLKIMANLDIAERRLPQDGRIRATVRGRNVDLRVSTLPLTHGEKCVIRILDNRSILVGLENLGMWDDTLDTFRRQVLQPHGIVLVTGPTGSGKSTTLYSALQVMDGDTLNISTVEDPVEYELAFANQVGVHDAIGMTFSAALRSLLRQDPDVIMLGEIRDEETARIAIQASLTGHLVLSTLHTNDAPSSITRLINIGIEPYLISASMNAVLAQRLVRRICPNCKTQVKDVKEADAAYLRRYGGDPSKLYQGAGCDKCRQTGYKGRLGIYELLEINDEMRDLVSRNPSLGELRTAAKGCGMRSLRDDGLQKIASGMTTVEELAKVTEG